MKKLLVIGLILGFASMANAALVLNYVGDNASGTLGINLSEVEKLWGTDIKVEISDGAGTIGEATNFAMFGGVKVDIAPVAGNDNGKRRYSGAAIPGFGGTAIQGPIEVIGGMPVTVDGFVTIDLVVIAGGTILGEDPDGPKLEAGVVDSITIPEPMTMTLLGLGGLALIRRRR